MNGTNALVNIAGTGIIAWIAWYFCYWKPSTLGARFKDGGQIQGVEITVKG